jgi:predicted amidohydrolase
VQDAPDYRETNFRRVEPLIREAAAAGAKVACTTECFLDGYYREVSDQRADLTEIAERCEVVETSVYVRRLKALAGELRIAIVAGMAIREGDRLFNSAQLYTPAGELAGIYRKTHNFGRHSRWFSVLGAEERASSYPSFDVGGGRAGLMICNDRGFAHTSVSLARNGSEVLFCPTGGSYDFASLAGHASRVGLWSIWVHPLGCAMIDHRGRTVVHERNPLSDDFLAVPAAEVGTADDRRFVVLGEVELRAPASAPGGEPCAGDRYDISSR